MSAAAIAIPGDLRLPEYSAVLPFVWAVASQPAPVRPAAEPPAPSVAFYRKYTEALLRRYLRMSLEAGRIPSLLGQEMFRAKVTSYRVQSFEDVVIFLHDVDRCLEQLDAAQRDLIARISLQEFTVGEVAASLGDDPRTVIRHYNRALDRLTGIFLDVEMLEPFQRCQGGGL